jgi:predicted SAM-dependent methyltransferase
MLLRALSSEAYQTRVSVVKLLYYELERWFGDRFLKRHASTVCDFKLLNLGCGPLMYPGFCNADDYGFKRSLRQKGYTPDWRLDITKPWLCESDYWEGIFSQHVVEHLSYSDAVFTFRECLRTLVPGGWLRVSVPSLSKYVDYYNGRLTNEAFSDFPCPALALSFLAQMHFHKSVWDADLMVCILEEVGFCNAKEVAYGEGSDHRLLKDQEGKAWESLYVEAKKPER